MKKSARREVHFSSVTRRFRPQEQCAVARSRDRRQIIAQLEVVRMTNIYASHIWKSCQRATCPHTREHVVCARCVKLRAVASRRSVSTRFAKPVLFPYPRTELLAQFIFLLLFFTLERKGRKMNHARSLVLGYGNRTGLRFMSRRSARNVATFRIRVSSINQLVNCGFDIVQCTRDHEIDSYLLFF